MDFGCFVELQGFRTKQVRPRGTVAAAHPPAAALPAPARDRPSPGTRLRPLLPAPAQPGCAPQPVSRAAACCPLHPTPCPLQEGLVHLSNISSTKRGGSAKELVSKGEACGQLGCQLCWPLPAGRWLPRWLGSSPPRLLADYWLGGCAASVCVCVCGMPLALLHLACLPRWLPRCQAHATSCTHAFTTTTLRLPPAGDPVWVKVVSKTGQRLGLAMRDVDQVTGEGREY